MVCAEAGFTIMVRTEDLVITYSNVEHAWSLYLRVYN